MGARAYLLSAPCPSDLLPGGDPRPLGIDRDAAHRLAAVQGAVFRCDGMTQEQTAWLESRAGSHGAVVTPADGDPRGLVIGCPVAVLGKLAGEAARAHPPLGDALSACLAPIERRPATWRLPSGPVGLEGGARVMVMAILNVTPDSFSDGGRYLEPTAAREQGLRLAAEGADIIDVGGESSRPGAAEVPLEEECRRTVPVIEALREVLPSGVVLSIDTMKAGVARAAVAAGAAIINDVSALAHDPQMPEAAAELGAAVILNHMKGTPATMQNDPRYASLIPEIVDSLDRRLEAAVRAGISPERIALDPGFGFGKRPVDNAVLLRHLQAFACLGRPLAVGISRKSFLGRVAPDGGAASESRADATLAAETIAVMAGAHVLRTHEPARARRAAVVAQSRLSYHSEQDRC